MSADDRRDPTDRPPAVARGPEPLRRRTPTIPYGTEGSSGEAVLPRLKPALRGIRAKTMPPPTLEAPPETTPSPLPPKSTAAINSERYENLRASVEFTAVRDDIDEPYDLEEALGQHLAWLTDDEAKAELFKQLQKGDHGRVLSTMTEARRRYPRNLSIGRCIQIVERAAIARLLERIGPLVLVPEPVGKPVLGRDPATLFAQIDGKATFEDVLRASPFTRLRSLEILAELVRRSAVRVRDDQLPAAVAHLRGASGRTPPHRRASSMRPALSAPVPFADDDATGRATMPDPLEVATRAALLKEPYESERTPKAPDVGAQRISTPRVSGSQLFDRRTSAGGFRAAPRKETFDAPTPAARRALDDRAEYDFPEVRANKTGTAGRVDSPFPGKAQRKGTVRAAAVGVVVGADPDREAAAVRARGRVADERRDEDDDDEQDDIAAKALREVQLERARQAQLARDKVAEQKVAEQKVADQKSKEPPESVPARKTLESIAPSSPVEREAENPSEPDPLASHDESRSSPPPEVAPSVSLLTPTPAVVAPRLEVVESPRMSSAHEREPRKLSTGVLGLAALAIVLCFVAVVIAITRTTPAPAPIAQQTQQVAPPRETAPPAQPTAPEPAPKGALADTIRLVIDASPRDARVYVDDVLLTGHPIDQKLPRDGKTHQLRIEAIGYRTSKTTFDANADTKLIIGLEIIPQKAVAPVPPKSSEVYP